MTPTKKTTKRVVGGQWIDDIADHVGRAVALETKDGIKREGRLSGIGHQSLVFNGKTVNIITDLELNGDPHDRIPLDRIQSLTAL